MRRWLIVWLCVLAALGIADLVRRQDRRGHNPRKEVFQMAGTSSPTSTGGTRTRTGEPFPVEPNVENYYDQTAYAAPDAGVGYIPPQRELASSPEWLAYLNALGVQEQALRADTDKMRGLYQSDATRQLQDLPAGYGQQRRGIAGSMENRGMARSGEMLRRLAENRAAQGRAEAGVNAQLGFQLGSLESQLAQKLVELNTQRASQEASMRAQGYV